MAARTTRVEVHVADLEPVQQVIAAAVAWVERIQDPPRLWADAEDRALIRAVQQMHPGRFDAIDEERA